MQPPNRENLATTTQKFSIEPTKTSQPNKTTPFSIKSKKKNSYLNLSASLFLSVFSAAHKDQHCPQCARNDVALNTRIKPITMKRSTNLSLAVAADSEGDGEKMEKKQT